MAEQWRHSQAEVEKAMAHGPKSIKQLIDITTFSRSTVYKALERAEVVKDNNWPPRYSLVKSALSEPQGAETVTEIQYIPIVEPVAYEAGTAAIRWQEGREKFSQALKKLDLSKMSLPEAKEQFRGATATLLGLVIELDKIEDGPDWRERAGL